MIFVSGVIHFTIIASEKVKTMSSFIESCKIKNHLLKYFMFHGFQMAFPFLTVLRLVAPLLWYTTLGFLDDQLRQEVELTEIVIMKHLIDFRCGKIYIY